MTLSGLRSRAAKKRARITQRDGWYTVIDNHTQLQVGSVQDLIQLEDLINHLDSPGPLAAEARTETHVVLSQGYWGSGASLETAKRRFREAGGVARHLTSAYGWLHLIFDVDTKFHGVDNMGYYSWTGNEPIKHTHPRKESKR